MLLEPDQNVMAVPSAFITTPGFVDAPQWGGLLPEQMKASLLPEPVPASLALTSCGTRSGRAGTAGSMTMRRAYTWSPVLAAAMSEHALSKTTIVPSRLRPG